MNSCLWADYDLLKINYLLQSLLCELCLMLFRSAHELRVGVFSRRILPSLNALPFTSNDKSRFHSVGFMPLYQKCLVNNLLIPQNLRIRRLEPTKCNQTLFRVGKHLSPSTVNLVWQRFPDEPAINIFRNYHDQISQYTFCHFTLVAKVCIPVNSNTPPIHVEWYLAFCCWIPSRSTILISFPSVMTS